MRSDFVLGANVDNNGKGYKSYHTIQEPFRSKKNDPYVQNGRFIQTSVYQSYVKRQFYSFPFKGLMEQIL